MLVLIWVAVLIISVVLYLRDVYSRLAQRQLRSLRTVPLLGHMHKVLLRQEHFTKALQRTYKAFPEDKIVGHYEFINPLILVRDLELIKRITIRDFEYFVDKRFVGAFNDPLFSRTLLLLKGEEWKSMRSTLSPAFTSSKIKLMVPFMLEVGEKMTEELKRKIVDSQEGYLDMNIKDLTSRFANDVIATCAFGLKVNSMTTDNEFYKKARDVTTFDLRRFLKFIGYRSFPWLMKLFKITLIPAQHREFFTNVVIGTMRQREKHNIIRNDMIHLLMEAKKGQLTHETNIADTPAGFAAVEESEFGKKYVKADWSDTDLVAQAVVFLVGGFGTISTESSFLLHEVAANPDVQDKLVKEIMETEAQNGGTLNYDSIQKMVYLDMVVSETLRLWPAAPLIDRLCVKSYNAGKPNKMATRDFVVKKDEVLTIPAWAIHRDSQYFPNPDKFNPERFSQENRQNIKPFTYMPFGIGPRNCIGSRFALCEVKFLVYQILKSFEVTICEKSCVPARLVEGSLAMELKGGHWLRIKIRQH